MKNEQRRKNNFREHGIYLLGWRNGDEPDPSKKVENMTDEEIENSLISRNAPTRSRHCGMIHGVDEDRETRKRGFDMKKYKIVVSGKNIMKNIFS